MLLTARSILSGSAQEQLRFGAARNGLDSFQPVDSMSRPLLIMHVGCYDDQWDRLDEGLHHLGENRNVSLWVFRLSELSASDVKHAHCVCNSQQSW